MRAHDADVMSHRAAGGIGEQLADARGHRVVFVSHCLLNENVRFLGGATRRGAVREVLDPYVADGVGIVQLPCPEQRSWGGVLKRRMLVLYGRRILRVGPLRHIVVAAIRAATRLEYSQLARRVAREIADYVSSGFEVVAVVGVGASPSCGVATTVDLDRAVAAMAACDRDRLDAATVRERVVASNAVGGQGLFVAGLRRQLARRGISLPFQEYDLLGELRETPVAVERPDRAATTRRDRGSGSPTGRWRRGRRRSWSGRGGARR
jgi:predicted secreted protein